MSPAAANCGCASAASASSPASWRRFSSCSSSPPTWPPTARCSRCSRGRVGPLVAAEPRHPAPAHRHVGARLHRRRVGEGPRPRPGTVLRVRHHAVCGHGEEALPRGVHWACGHCGCGPLRHDGPRADPRRHLAGSLRRGSGRRLPASAEPLFHRRRRPVRHRHRAGHGRSARSRGRHSRRRERLHLSGHCRGDGPARRGRRAAFVPVLRHPWHRHGGPGEIRRQLVHCRGPHLHHRAAGLHHRRWRHAPHSPDRHHAALHQPGRLLTHRQLHHRRLPAALRRRGHRRRLRNAPDRGHRRPRSDACWDAWRWASDSPAP